MVAVTAPPRAVAPAATGPPSALTRARRLLPRLGALAFLAGSAIW